MALNELKSKILVGLIEIRDNGPKIDYHGICYNLKLSIVEDYGNYTGYDYHLCEKVDYWLYETFPLWSKFSGELTYPIQTKDLSPWESYYKLELWNTEVESGKLRYELLDFLISVLVEEDRKA
jgi:hypothetical protein